MTGESVLGTTARYPEAGSDLRVDLGTVVGSVVSADIQEGGTSIGWCAIVPVDMACYASLPALTPGEHELEFVFQDAVSTERYSGTLLVVDNAAPDIAIEWRDAAGTWVDGTGAGIPLAGTTAARCVITNASNASFEFVAFEGSVSHLSTPPAVPITGSLAAGASRVVDLWSGPVVGLNSASCSGSISYATGIDNGGGTGGGVIQVTSGFALSAATAAPGGTLTLTATGVDPGLGVYPVAFDGAPVAGSPASPALGEDSFTIPVPVPAGAAPGTHTVTVAVVHSGRTFVLAVLPVTVPAAGGGSALAATGVDALALGAGALLLVLAGGALLAVRARRQAATASASRIV